MTQGILAWHFVGETLRDGSPIPADGVVLRHDGPLVMCESGLHASRKLMHALEYAPGETLCRDDCACDIIEDSDKLICRERTILWRLDATDLLWEFARRCALDVVHLWDAPEVVLDYLRSGDETKRSAAAMDATAATTWNAAWAASIAISAAASAATTSAVASAAARDSASAAAWATADATSVAWAAAWAAARATQSARLNEMVARAAAQHGLLISMDTTP